MLLQQAAAAAAADEFLFSMKITLNFGSLAVLRFPGSALASLD
jgi:hypothetical protein